MSYLAIYIVMTLGSFVCVLQMRDKDGNPVEDIASLAGLSQSRNGLAAALAIFMFSLAGIPPLFGFWAKFLVVDAAVGAGLRALRSEEHTAEPTYLMRKSYAVCRLKK